MKPLQATIEGIGFWAPGLPSWDAARAYANGGELVADAPARPSPQLLAPNERRRAPEPVAVALEVALAACTAAAREPIALPSVFASASGDLVITDYMCAALASDPRSISPTRFHNSVHNAAAGYWTIGTGAMQPATALSAGDATFAQALIEALVQLASGADAVLLAAYDGASAGPLKQVVPSEGLLGAAMVLSRHVRDGAPVLAIELGDDRGEAAAGGVLSKHAAGNAMAQILPVFDALARDGAHGSEESVILRAGAGRALTVRICR